MGNIMGRSDYLIRKIGFAISTLIAVIVFNFFLFRILPGDPIKLIIHSPRMTREAQDRIRANFGLDKPVWLDVEALVQGDLYGAFDLQFTAYIRNLLIGEMGVLVFYPPGCLRATGGTSLADGRADRARRGACHNFRHHPWVGCRLATWVAHRHRHSALGFIYLVYADLLLWHHFDYPFPGDLACWWHGHTRLKAQRRP